MSDGTETMSSGATSTLAEEDQARANLYGVLARLWYAAPDRALLDVLSRSVDAMEDAGDTALANAWRALARAAAQSDPDALIYEYDSLFIGTGSAEITLYCSHYLTETGRERVVIALRDELRELGLGRAPGANEPEDHLSALLEIMRHAIVEHGDVPQLGLQKAFFLSYIQSSYAAITNAVMENGGAAFYKDVARLTRAFLDVESRSFDMI